MRYPNGQSYQSKSTVDKKKNKLKKPTTFAKRGMKLEDMINRSNEWYNNRKIAVIHKKPTPIQVVNVKYPKRSAAVITEAYYRQASTTDYNGIYQGNYIDFEAKQTDLVTGFPIRNIHQHQVTHMKNCEEQGGITFVIILFQKSQKAFLYPFQYLLKDWEEHQKSGASKITLTRIQTKGFEIPFGFQPELDYIKALDLYLASR